MKETIAEIIEYYELKINNINSLYLGTQQTDNERINYKKWSRTHVEQKELLEDIVVDLKRIKDVHEKAVKFKSYVHERLDKLGIPADPEPEKNATTGCRIEGRLNYIDEKLQQLDTMIQSELERDFRE